MPKVGVCCPGFRIPQSPSALYSNYDPSGTVLTAGTDYGTPEQKLVGALVVDLYNRNAKKLVWRGTAMGVMNQKSFEKNKERWTRRSARCSTSSPIRRECN